MSAFQTLNDTKLVLDLVCKIRKLSSRTWVCGLG